MIIITGAAGFIGSCLAARFNEELYYNLGLVDAFGSERKNRNYQQKKFLNVIERDEFPAWLDLQHDSIDIVYHLGARTDTTLKDKAIFDRLNLEYSKEVFTRCAEYGIPLVYASSAATYGNGAQGYEDQESGIPHLHPLNPYGESKQLFDRWVLEQKKFPPRWYGLKFFNVYGPNEYHKGRMASVIFHAFQQIQEHGKVKLFRSHKQGYKDGEQLRDFIYVKDVADVLFHLYLHTPPSGIYNLGTGQANTFLSLAHAVFSAMGKHPDIEWIDIPADIRNSYQYFTEAKMEKWRSTGYQKPFTSLEAGITDYVQQYLLPDKIW